MKYDPHTMKLVAARPDGSGFFSVQMPHDTPDGAYLMPEAKIVIRTASRWTLWRYLLVILGTVFRPGTAQVRNLILVGPGVWRLTGFPGTRRLRDWAASLGVLLSGHEESPPCRCSNCIERRACS
jgi:hypothetical protein